MRLRASLPRISYIAYVGIIVAVVYGLYTTVQPRMVSFFIDGKFAPHIVQHCKTLLTPEYVRSHSSHEALQSLHNSLAGCEQCSIRYTGFQKAVVNVKGFTPFVKINQNLVLTQAGTIMPATELQEAVLERLPTIKVTDPTVSQPETIAHITAFMRELPGELFENHAIIWANKTAIYLIDQAVPESAIVALYTTRFTPELMNSIAHLQEKIRETSKKKGRISQKKIIDVRVKGQVIVKHMQGGDYENTSGEKYYNSN